MAGSRDDSCPVRALSFFSWGFFSTEVFFYDLSEVFQIPYQHSIPCLRGTSPLTNPKASVWDRVRTQVWFSALRHESGLQGPEQIGLHIAAALQLEKYDFRSFRRYADGKQHAGLARRPHTCGEWVIHAAKVWPATAAWFRTPLWFIFSNQTIATRDLLLCARCLPVAFQEDFLPQMNSGGPAVLHLEHTPRDFLYTFVDPLNPWSLGALACAFKRAEIAGDAGCMRWAAVGILWAIESFLKDDRPSMQEPLGRLFELVESKFNAPFRGLRQVPITDKEVFQFGHARQRYMDYFADMNFAPWELGGRPPWAGQQIPAGSAIAMPESKLAAARKARLS